MQGQTFTGPPCMVNWNNATEILSSRYVDDFSATDAEESRIHCLGWNKDDSSTLTLTLKGTFDTSRKPYIYSERVKSAKLRRGINKWVFTPDYQ